MSVAYFLALLCAPGKCIETEGITQVSVPAWMVSYTRPAEMYPRGQIGDRLYVLVPESKI
jgi:hypothetical protein